MFRIVILYVMDFFFLYCMFLCVCVCVCVCMTLCSVRHTGQEWLVRKFGAYLPGVYEEVRLRSAENQV